MKFVDDDGEEIKYAPGLKNAAEVRAIVQAILANPDTRPELAGYVGKENPDLSITSGDLSKWDTTTSKNGIVTTTEVYGQAEPHFSTGTGSVGPPETVLTDATITIDSRVSKGGLPGVVLHESKHVGDARRDPAGHLAEVKRESGKKHDDRTHEQRAIQFSKQQSNAIKNQAKQILKRQKEKKNCTSYGDCAS